MVEDWPPGCFIWKKPPFISGALLAVSWLLLWRTPFLVIAQAPQTYDLEAEFRQSAGPHSGPLAMGYFDRASDQTPDPLTKKQRQAKERSLSGSWRGIFDPGELVTGQLHDANNQIVDLMNPSGAVPIAYAKAIVTARLQSAHAFVAKNHQSVYSEYTFAVTKVYKRDDRRLKTESRIITTRAGGSIFFPSGHRRDFVEEGEGAPKVDSEYILFLWRPPTATRLDYGISAVYEILDGKLYALDWKRPFTNYEGKSAEEFLVQIEMHRSSRE